MDNSENKIQREQIHIPIYDNQTLAIHRIGNQKGHPIILIHGSVENSKIFHSSSGKGWAWYLARNGFDVFAADLSGKGESRPLANKESKQTQTDVITTEITALMETVESIKGKGVRIALGGHSWGGVLLISFMARFPQKYNIACGVFFGTKRRISIFNLEKFFKIDIMWNRFGRWYSKKEGFLNATKLKLGSDNEPLHVYRQTNEWVFSKSWKDPVDGFNYHEALKKVEKPPLMFLTGINDTILGNPVDVKLLIDESAMTNYEMHVIGKKHGYLNDYDHINLLTHPQAEQDHFPMTLEYLKKHLRENH
jgi:predicted alpha/beta hydrolase